MTSPQPAPGGLPSLAHGSLAHGVLPSLAHGARRPSPELLVGGSRVLRLSSSGVGALDALLSGRSAPGVDVLRRRLVDAGLLLVPPGPSRLSEVTVVVPARATAVEVQRVRDGVPAGVPVVVVDDAGVQPRGPAATRNLGAREVGSELIAFVDTGVHLPPGALERLSGHFDDPQVVAVAPRVVSDAGRGAVGVLEQSLCALDQGAVPALVRPGAVVSYLPSTVLLVRRSAFEEVAGFDEQLRVGEDVDLVWRLSEIGVVRYDPEVVVRHAPRTLLLAALRRRVDYGTSAGPLDLRHPGRLRHLRVSRWSALPWTAALVHPVWGPVAAAAVVATAPRRLTTLPPPEARRLTLSAQWSSFRAAGRYAVRPAWPLTLTALVASRRARRALPLLGAAYLAGSSTRLLPGPVRELPVRSVLHVADDLAYSAGVWRSARRTRRWRVLLPGGASEKNTCAQAFSFPGSVGGRV